MVNNNLTITERTGHFVSTFLESLPCSLLFHNLRHTLEVVAAVLEISQHEKLSTEEVEIAQIAAWFHDTGYLIRYLGHEDESALIAKKFLENQAYPKNKLGAVLACIHATTYPQRPHTIIEKVVSDADMYHFSLKNYEEYAQLLRKEWEVHLGNFYSDEEWQQSNLVVLKEHYYHTDYGKCVLQQRKGANILSGSF